MKSTNLMAAFVIPVVLTAIFYVVLALYMIKQLRLDVESLKSSITCIV